MAISQEMLNKFENYQLNISVTSYRAQRVKSQKYNQAPAMDSDKWLKSSQCLDICECLIWQPMISLLKQTTTVTAFTRLELVGLSNNIFYSVYVLTWATNYIATIDKSKLCISSLHTHNDNHHQIIYAFLKLAVLYRAGVRLETE